MTPMQMRLRAAIELLGSTANEIAETLTFLGYHGRRGSNCRCPLANYLRSALAFPGITVGATQLMACSAAPALTLAEIDTPGVAAAFIRCFDRGAFSSLVDTERS